MMEIKIIEEKDNGLFGRKEVSGSIESEVTPSRSEVLETLAKRFSVPEENIKIKGIHGKFGAKMFDIEANVYSSREEKDLVEIKKKKEAEAEKKMIEASKVEEAAPTEENKSEEKKE